MFTIDSILTVPPDSLSDRRRKFRDGLRFRGIAAIVFAGVLAVLAVVTESSRYVDVIPYILAEALVNPLYWWWGLRNDFPLRQFYVHWLVDLILIGCVLHFLGGIDVPYGFLAYLMIVVTSATFISKYASFLVATSATIATTVLVMLDASGVAPAPRMWLHEFNLEAQIAAVAFVGTFYFMFAYLTGTLADQLKSTNSELQEARRRIEEHNKRLEDAVVRRTAELQRRTAEAEEFMHIVTHDLKNVSIGATETVRKLGSNDGTDLGERERRYLGHLSSDLRSMNDMLRHLLAIFRVGSEELRRHPVDVQELVAALLKQNERRVAAKAIRISSSELPVVQADARQLTHVLGNIIDNAIKYVGDKEHPAIDLGAKRGGRAWLFWIKDNGVGIPPEQQERIFHLYHRVPRGESRGVVDEGGDGVGLAMTKRIVERWGGRLWVESEEGRGSVFWFSVPDPPK